MSLNLPWNIYITFLKLTFFIEKFRNTFAAVNTIMYYYGTVQESCSPCKTKVLYIVL